MNIQFFRNLFILILFFSQIVFSQHGVYYYPQSKLPACGENEGLYYTFANGWQCAHYLQEDYNETITGYWKFAKKINIADATILDPEPISQEPGDAAFLFDTKINITVADLLKIKNFNLERMKLKSNGDIAIYGVNTFLNPDIADISDNVAYKFNTTNNLTNCYLLQIDNNHNTKLRLRANGNLSLFGNKTYFNPDISNEAGNIAYILDTNNNLTTANLLSIKNNGAEKLSLNPYGSLAIQGSINALGANNYFDNSRIRLGVYTYNGISGAGMITYTNAPLNIVNNNLANAPGAIAFNFDTGKSLTAMGTKLISIKNAGSEKFSVDRYGFAKMTSIQLRKDGGMAKPACDSTTRGIIFYDERGEGEADTVEVCTKNADDTYSWKSIF